MDKKLPFNPRKPYAWCRARGESSKRAKKIFPPDNDLKPVGQQSPRRQPQVSLVHDDCLHTMRSMEANSCDSLVTDPPYGIGALGYAWDKKLPPDDVLFAMLRILKPGSHCVFFGHDKTQHLLILALENAGFELVQNFVYLKCGAIPTHQDMGNLLRAKGFSGAGYDRAYGGFRRIYEPIVVVRKPRDPSCRTWEDNIAEWGVGCMLAGEITPPGPQDRIFLANDGRVDGKMNRYPTRSMTNLLDWREDSVGEWTDDLPFLRLNGADRKDFHQEQRAKQGHEFKKPVSICEKLVRLVTPPGGLVFDPYAGRTPIGVACINTGRSYIGCEIDQKHAEAGQARLAKAEAGRDCVAHEPIAIAFATAEIATQRNRQKSFLRWVGGKRGLIDKIDNQFPLSGKRLIEPFVGAANVFLNSDFQSYILYDANRDLIDLFNHLKFEGDKLIALIEWLFSEGHGTEKVYLSRRQRFNRCRPGIWRSALFVYLNRNCFNGVARYDNRRGKFNVGWRKATGRCPAAELRAFQKRANEVECEFVCGDFSQAFARAEVGDTIYVDPPYLALDGAKTNFTGYQGAGFDEEDHLCLASLCGHARETGCRIAVSNHDSRLAHLVYEDADEIGLLTTRGTVAGSSEHRIARREMLAIYRPILQGSA